MKLTGILFDKDGTLIDYAATWDEANWRAALFFADGRQERAEILMEAGGWDRATGRTAPGSPLVAGTVRDIAQVWASCMPPHLGDAAIIEGLLAPMMTMNLPVKPLCDLGNLFDELLGLGLKLGIATNDTEGGIAATLGPSGPLAHHNLMARMSFLAGFDSGHGGKPGPGMVAAFIDHLETEPGNVMMVGDNTHDMQAGRAAGAITIGVLSGDADPADLAPLADHIIPSVADLPGLIRDFD